MKVWLDGELRSIEAARITPTDRGVLFGDGLFETILVQAGRPRRLGAHLARLETGAQVIGLKLPSIDFAAALMATLAANDLFEAASLRLTITRGTGPRGVLPPADLRATLLITGAPLSPLLPPAHCILATSTRRNEHSPLAAIKSLNYLDNIIARQEAKMRGADDAILLNTSGYIAETTAANLFVVRNGRIVTPPVEDGALPGVMRAAVLALGAVETRLVVKDVLSADEAFLTSSLGIRPVCQIEHHKLAAVWSPTVRAIEQAVMSFDG